MNNGRMNYLAVVAAGVVYWLVQAGWYTVFAQQWLAGIGKTREQLSQGGESPLPYTVSLVCDIAVAYVLAWVVTRTGEHSLGRGVAVGTLLWLGLVATTMETNYIFEGRSIELFAINGGVALLGMLLMGAIIGAW